MSLGREGNEVRGAGGLKQRERAGASRGAGALGPPAGGETRCSKGRRLAASEHDPRAARGVAWRGETPLRRPAGGELPSAAPAACWLCGSRAAGPGPGRPPAPRLPRVTAPHTPLPQRTAQKGSFPLLSPTQCLFPCLKKKKDIQPKTSFSAAKTDTRLPWGGGSSPHAARGGGTKSGEGGEANGGCLSYL